jgi:hypothetical protein
MRYIILCLAQHVLACWPSSGAAVVRRLRQEVKRKCSNLLTATAPDDGQQAETCCARQSII